MSALIQLNNLQRQLGGVSILKGITAEVFPGQVIALLGKNGAGKTTLLETLLGFAFPSFGEARISGVDATKIDGAIKQQIGFVPQQTELLPGQTAAEHLALFKSFRVHWNQHLVDRLVAEWLIPMDLRVGKMSVGQQQKLSIILAMAHEPELLILDEPVASLDPIARRQFLQQLVEVAADENRAVIFSTHIISDVERVANQVWMMRDGHLIYQGGLDELKESVARLTIYSDVLLPINLPLSNVIRQRITGKQAIVTIAHWKAELQQEIVQQLNAEVMVEYLSLEDIFLEMNDE